MTDARHTAPDYADVVLLLRRWAKELGFQQLGICDTDLSVAEGHLLRWLALQRHGQMHYMARHGSKRSRPEELEPGTLRVISVRMDYLPSGARASEDVLDDPASAFISRYALGRDYHKLLRSRLQKLATRLERHIGPFGYRAFVDSAPVLEKPLAAKAGLGWIGKHTNLLNREAGSWFFLGELYTDLPLPVDSPVEEHCGACTRCIDVCPTRAIVAPYELDARLCISYLTIELHGPIPEALRPALGNRVYGCDDCQMVCPWNRFAQFSGEGDFLPRNDLDTATLAELFAWEEEEFLTRTEGSAIRRIGYERWLRNLAVGLGNCLSATDSARAALLTRVEHPSELVREHVCWALRRLDL
ncbi:MAG: tRNA epoxyqueuosine(34) reductase QueG [Chromatiales bacterium]|nr:tRNA epoxyqueuosine(34) reductase QueG [Chromatiales bacterium]